MRPMLRKPGPSALERAFTDIYRRNLWADPETFIHRDDASVFAAFATIRRSGAAYLLAGTFPGFANGPLEGGAGGWRPVNLEAPPFSLPAPIRRLLAAPLLAGYEEKCLALWPAAALPD